MDKAEPSGLYGPLDPERKEIRILHVEDELDVDGRVQCQLEVVSLLDLRAEDSSQASNVANVSDGASERNAALSFEAISWTWGETTKEAKILLNDHQSDVSANAEIVLRQLCLAQKHRTVWLDTICINQQDLVERQHQIAAMRDVYKGAASVLIWLGEEDEHTSAALNSIDMLVAQCRDFAGHDDALHDVFFDDKGIVLLSNSSLPDCDWNAVRSFFSRPWFTRVWVVQEVMLSRSSMCHLGSQSRKSSDVYLAAQWLYHRSYFRSDYIGHVHTGVEAAAQIWCSTYRSHSLTDLLSMSIDLSCSLAHDKVYGMLGLMQDDPTFASAGIEIVPDYSADLATVYASATKAAIATVQDQSYALNILEFAQALVPILQEQEEEDKDWPTWVPRYHWEIDMRKGTPSIVRAYGHAANSVGYLHPAQTASSQTLFAGGVIVSGVGQYTAALSLSVFTSDSDRYSWTTNCHALGSSPGHSREDLALTLTCGSTRSISDARQDPDHAAGHKSYLTSSGVDFADLSGQAQEFVNAMWQCSANRVFFTTESGIIGMGPPQMQAADHVCILYGASVPYILRTEGDHFTLVGNAYVHGIMDGSYIRKLQVEGRLEEETQWFEIH